MSGVEAARCVGCDLPVALLDGMPVFVEAGPQRWCSMEPLRAHGPFVPDVGRGPIVPIVGVSP